jgi:hypothetical protein
MCPRDAPALLGVDRMTAPPVWSRKVARWNNEVVPVEAITAVATNELGIAAGKSEQSHGPAELLPAPHGEDPGR